MFASCFESENIGPLGRLRNRKVGGWKNEWWKGWDVQRFLKHCFEGWHEEVGGGKGNKLRSGSSERKGRWSRPGGKRFA